VVKITLFSRVMKVKTVQQTKWRTTRKVQLKGGQDGEQTGAMGEEQTTVLATLGPLLARINLQSCCVALVIWLRGDWLNCEIFTAIAVIVVVCGLVNISVQ